MSDERRRAAALRHARMLESLDERDVGISDAASRALGEILEEPEVQPTVHYAPARRSKALCGVQVAAHARNRTDVAHLVTCEDCRTRAEREQAREELSLLRVLAKAPCATARLPKDERVVKARWRLESKGLAEVRELRPMVRALLITDLGRKRLTEAG